MALSWRTDSENSSAILIPRPSKSSTRLIMGELYYFYLGDTDNSQIKAVWHLLNFSMYSLDSLSKYASRTAFQKSTLHPRGSRAIISPPCAYFAPK